MGAFSYFQKKKAPEPAEDTIPQPESLRVQSESSMRDSVAEDPYRHIRQNDARKGQHAGFKSYRLIGT